MPSLISHIVAGSSLGYAFNNRKKDTRFWLLVVFISILPDLDVLAFSFGIPYGHVFGHRGFLHSLVFALMVSLAPVLVFYRNRDIVSAESIRMLFVFLIIAAAHPLLDAMTGGGMGIGLFIPFNNERLFFPWRPIAVSPIGIREFFSQWGVRVIQSELRYIIVPSLAFALIIFMLRIASRHNTQE